MQALADDITNGDESDDALRTDELADSHELDLTSAGIGIGPCENELSVLTTQRNAVSA
jgi:hypothetical protein